MQMLAQADLLPRERGLGKGGEGGGGCVWENLFADTLAGNLGLAQLLLVGQLEGVCLVLLRPALVGLHALELGGIGLRHLRLCLLVEGLAGLLLNLKRFPLLQCHFLHKTISRHGTILRMAVILLKV